MLYIIKGIGKQTSIAEKKCYYNLPKIETPC